MSWLLTSQTSQETRRGPAARLASLMLAGGVLVYTVGYLAWYSRTPLGLVPVADERELLALAVAMARAELPPEAFYRAPGYSALLALVMKLGWPQAHLVLGARLLNGLCHLASTWLCYHIASRLWRSHAAGVIAVVLVGFNPVLLHFAGDALDITLAITLMLAGFALANSSPQPRRRTSALCLALAGLCRPQLLALLVVPVVACGQKSSERQALAQRVAGVWPALLVLGAFGLVNYQLAGDFRVLPWQGAFNFWAANHAGATGRYFAQTRTIDVYDDATNTARVESEILYREANPHAPADYQSVTRWWQTQALVAISSDPLAWATRVAFKLRYLVNNEEQYNLKTFAFHKARSPWLRPNPLCWSLVWVTGVFGLALGWRKPGLRLLAIAIGVLAGATLLLYVSDRFRAPLVPMLAIAAGGIVRATPRTARMPALVALCAAAASLWPVGYAPRETWVQDHLLLARSANTLQEHVLAVQEADAALALAPELPAARSTRCVVAFNAWLAEAMNAGWESDCLLAASHSKGALMLASYARWRRGEKTAAQAVWQTLAAEKNPFQASALAALQWNDALSADEAATVKSLEKVPAGRVIRLAAAAKGDRAALRSAVEALGEAQALREIRAIGRIWQPTEAAASPAAPAGH